MATYRKIIQIGYNRGVNLLKNVQWLLIMQSIQHTLLLGLLLLVLFSYVLPPIVHNIAKYC